MPVRITWLGHASVKIEGASRTVYIDPWKLSARSPADVILLTHDHYDHYSEPDIKSLKGPSTRIIAPMSTPLVTDTIAPGQSLTVHDLSIEAVYAYNIDKAFHPRSNKWVGFVVTIENLKVYHTGDTDRIPEMKDLSVDIALVPVGGTYTMDAAQAASVTSDVKARHAIPIHFGDIVGSKKDAQEFARLCSCTVHVLDPGRSVEIG